MYVYSLANKSSLSEFVLKVRINYLRFGNKPRSTESKDMYMCAVTVVGVKYKFKGQYIVC